MVNNLFKKAIKYMLDGKEFEKLLNCSKSRREKKEIEADYSAFLSVDKECGGIEKFPILPLLMETKSVEVLKDIIAIMIMLEAKENGGDRIR